MYMSEESQSLTVLKALADPMRLEILARFAQDEPVRGADALGACPRSQPTVSHHLGRLVEAGVITEQKDGTQKTYRLNRPLLVSLGLDINLLTRPNS
jgi:ArsR family transcriptional regulator